MVVILRKAQEPHQRPKLNRRKICDVNIEFKLSHWLDPSFDGAILTITLLCSFFFWAAVFLKKWRTLYFLSPILQGLFPVIIRKIIMMRIDLATAKPLSTYVSCRVLWEMILLRPTGFIFGY